MKNSIKMLAGSIAILALLSGTCLGQATTTGKAIRSTGEKVVTGKNTESSQDAIRLEKQKRLEFKGESTKSEVKLNMTDEFNYLGIHISCVIDKGSVAIELIDPDGKKQGSFVVKSEDVIVKGDNTTAVEHVNGQMKKVFGYPLKGEWIIRAIPSSAFATVDMFISQQFVPKIDMIDLNQIN